MRKNERNIFFAFILNFAFSIFEFVGGILTGSVAILSDAVHDIGDATSIGVSFLLEKKSKKQPNKIYTYGYARYSVFGSVITTLILLLGSIMVIYHSVQRIITPVAIHYDGMIVFAVVGVCINLSATLLTNKGESLNQKAVNLHMLEDVLGWIVVLLGAIVMRFTHFSLLDPLLSIGVALFILVNALKNFNEILYLFLERTPHGIDADEHIWSMDGNNHYATLHIVASKDACVIKKQVREELKEHGVCHVTIELEEEGETCTEQSCHVDHSSPVRHHHHHH